MREDGISRVAGPTPVYRRSVRLHHSRPTPPQVVLRHQSCFRSAGLKATLPRLRKQEHSHLTMLNHSKTRRSQAKPAFLTTRRSEHTIRPPGLRCARLPCSTYCSSTPVRAKRLAPFSSARLAPRPDGPLTHFASPRGEKWRLNTTRQQDSVARPAIKQTS